VIRVGFLCDHLDLGGQELGFLAVLRGLDRAHFAPHLYAFRPGSLLADAKALDIPIIVGHDKPGADSTWDARDEAARARYLALLSHHLRDDRIDVGLVFAWRDAIAAAKAAGLDAMVERIDGVVMSGKLRDKSAFQRIVCESKMIRDLILAQRKLLNCRREQLVVIPNGIDRERFDPKIYDRAQCRAALGIASDEFVVGTVARLDPVKNLSYLLRAIHHLRESAARVGKKIRGVIAGPDFGSKFDLEAECARLGLDDCVTFLGPRSDVPQILRALDVFALTSFTEGIPFAMLEAMAMGLPIVATAVGAIPELIDNNGYLVGVIHPEEAAAAMLELLINPKLARRLGERCRALSKKYDLARMLRGYERVLVEALSPAKLAATGHPAEDSIS
jgi:glycosyltransferase involved in cell wall biosynthesis